MRSTIPILLSILLSFPVSCKGQQTFTTPEMLGETIFNAIKNNDISTFRKHLINKKDLAYIKSLRPNDNNVDEVVNYKINGWKQYDEKIIDQIRSEGTNTGVNWDNAIFDHVEYKILDKEEPHKSDIYIFFTSNSEVHQIKMDDCLKVERGWIMFDDVTFNK